MTHENQVRTLAELDGHLNPIYSMGKWYSYESGTGNLFDADYLHSYDAILPLIAKQPKEIQVKIVTYFWTVEGDWNTDMLSLLNATPAQLSEYTIRATGKWIE